MQKLNPHLRELVHTYWPYATIALVSLATIIVWYWNGGLLYYADSTYPVGNPWDYVREFSYGWKSSYSGGIINSTGYAILPLFLFIGALHAIGFNAVFAQATFFFLILFVTGSGAILLLRYFGERYQVPESPLALLVPALFYVSNLYIAINGWRMLIFLYLFYAFLPVLIFLFLRYLDTERIQYVIIFSLLTSLIVAIALTNLGFLFILFAILPLLSVLYIGRKNFVRLARLYGLALLVWIPCNVWYLLPQFQTIADSATKATGGGNFLGSFSILNVVSSHASFLNVLSINGFYSLYDKTGGSWFPWTEWFTGLPFSILSLVFPFVLVVVLLSRRFSRKVSALYFLAAVLILVGAFFAKGSHEPAASFFIYLFQKFPVPFLAFRAAYEKLGIFVVLGYFFVLYLFYAVVLHVGAKRRSLWGGGLLLLVLLLGFPMWTGKIFESNNGVRTSAHIEIPSDYYEVAEILKRDPQAITLSLPLQLHAWASSKWDGGKNGYLGNDILRLLSGTPVISTDIGNTNIDKFNRIIEADFKESGVDTTNLVARQVSYVLIRKDINYEWGLAYGKHLPEISKLVDSIEMSGKFEKKHESQNLILYRLTDPAPRGYVFTMNQLFSFGAVSRLGPIDTFIRNNLSDQYVFTTDQTKAVASRGIMPLFSEVSPEQVDADNNKITNSRLALQSGSMTAYKTGGTPLVRINSTLQEIVLSANDSGSLDIDGEQVFSPSSISYRDDVLLKRNDENYFLRLGKEFVDLPEVGSVEFSNLHDTNSLEVYGAWKNGLIEDPSFDEGPWTPTVEDCSKTDDKQDIGMEVVSLEGSGPKTAISLMTRNHIACTHTRFDLSKPGDYLLLFNYRSLNKSKVGYAIDALGRDRFTMSNGAVPADTEWHTYSELVTIPPGYSDGSFFLYAYPTAGQENTVQYNDVRLLRVNNVNKVDLSALQSVATKSFDNVKEYPEVSYTGLKSDFGQWSITDWDKQVHDCSATGDESYISLDFPTDSQGGKIVRLSSDAHIACTFSTIPISSSADYILSFDYQVSSRNAAGYYIGFNDPEQQKVSKHFDTTTVGEWITTSVQFTAPKDASSAVIYLYAYGPNGTEKNVAQYRNVKLNRIPSISDKFYIVQDSPTVLVSPKNVAYEIVDPIKRIVHIKGATTPFYLSMSESYHPQWRLAFNNHRVQGWFSSWTPVYRPNAVPDEHHFELNGFLNGWYVDTDAYCVRRNLCTRNADGSYDMEMVIEFTPQRWFYVGLLISGTTLLGCLGYLGYAWVRGRRSTPVSQYAGIEGGAKGPSPYPLPSGERRGTTRGRTLGQSLLRDVRKTVSKPPKHD